MPVQEKVVNSLRRFRKLHRLLGLILAVFLLISAITGLLLAWKKDVAWIQPSTERGSTKTTENWLTLPELQAKAETALRSSQPDLDNLALDRIDVRPGKGMAKMLYEAQNLEVQIDGVTGEVLSIGKRRSDWIESLHDGSIISDLFKLLSMNFLGVGLVLLLGSGIWLWLGPRRIRLRRRRRN